MRHFSENEWYLWISSEGEAPETRREIEEDLGEILGDMGEVSGGGEREGGWRIEVELYVPENLEFIVEQVRTYLQQKKVARDACISVIRADRRPVYDDE